MLKKTRREIINVKLRNEKEKKIYEMLREHLKESEKYEACCKWFREKQKAPSLRWPTELDASLRIAFSHFGDVFEQSFEDWWETRLNPFEYSITNFIGSSVKEYDRQQYEHEYDAVKNKFEGTHGREPTLGEFKGLFMERLFNYLPASFLFRAFFPLDQSKAVSQFKELIKKNEKLPEVRKYMRRWQFVGKVGDSELIGWKRDLEAYRLKKKKNMKLTDVIKKLGERAQREDPDDADVRRTFNRYIKNAKDIIETLEQGYFPRE